MSDITALSTAAFVVFVSIFCYYLIKGVRRPFNYPPGEYPSLYCLQFEITSPIYCDL